LIVGKFVLGSSALVFNLFGVQKINYFNPGLAFLIVLVPVWLFWVKDGLVWKSSFKDSLKRTVGPFLVILIISVMVQLMLNSGLLLVVARGFENKFLPLISTFIGAFGSFLTGSATVSNIMFGKLVAEAAVIMRFDVATILALEVVGGAAGNMIALADILTTETTAGIKNKEREIIKGVIVPCFIYVFLVGLIGFLTTL
jgi:lactate permease